MKKLKKIITVIMVLCMCISSTIPNVVYAYTQATDESTGRKIIYNSYDSSYGKQIDSYLIPLLKERQMYIDVSQYKLEKNNVNDFYYAITDRNPETLWFVKGFSSNGTYTENGTEYVNYLYVYYSITDNEINQLNDMTTFINNEIDVICSGINKNTMSDAEIVYAVANSINSKIDYVRTDSLIENRLYNILKNHYAQCEGFKDLFRNIMNRYQIPCGVVLTTDHAFNIVKVNGEWYFTDTTTKINVTGAKSNSYLVGNSYYIGNNLNVIYPDNKKVGEESYDELSELINGDSTYSHVYYYNGYWYYGVKNKKEIIKSNLNGSKEVIATYTGDFLTTKIKIDDDLNAIQYLGTTNIQSASVSGVGNVLFYNTPSTIESINLLTGETKTLYQVSDSSMQCIISVAPNSETIGAYVRNYTYDENNELQCEFKLINFDYDGHLIHSWQVQTEKKATTTENGYTSYECSECGETKTTYSYATNNLKTSATVALETDSYEFSVDEKTHEPAVTVKDGDTILSNDSYTVSYDEAYRPGTYTVKVTGTNGYYGTITADFTIEHTKDHIYDDGNVVKEATCTEDGLKTYSCIECDETKEEIIEKTGHSYDNGVVTKKATEEENGERTFTCASCGDTYTEIIPMITHNFDNGVVTKEATCTEDGVLTYTCTDADCDKSYTEVIPATGHQNTEVRDEKDATCTEDGYTGDTYCKDCKKVIEEGKSIKATGHQNTELRDEKEATCAEEGYTGDTYCKDCGKKLSSGTVINAYGHSYDSGVVTKKATEKKAGVMTYTCKNCGTTKTEEIPILKDHTWDSGKVTKEATCTESGIMTYTCTNEDCKETYETSIPATGHQNTEVQNKKDATCTEAGYSGDTYCKDCNTLLVQGTETSMLTHAWNSGKVTKEATALSAGTKTYTCKNCKMTKTETIQKLSAKAVMNASSIVLKVSQSTKKFAVTSMTKGDSVKSWTSSNTKIATVSGKADGTCTIKATKKTGNATITITFASGLTKTVKVKVQKSAVACTKITGLSTSASIGVKKTLTLKPVISPITCVQKVTYTSSNEKIAKVNSKGVITGVKKGSCTITVKCGKKKATIKVTVK